MSIRFYLLLLSFGFVLSMPTQAQQLPEQVEHLKAELVKAKALLQEIEEQRDSLQSLSGALQDSASFEAALDSLQARYEDPLLFQSKADSLTQAFSSRQATLLELSQAEEQLQAAIAKATAALARELLAGEAEAVLASLQQAGSAGAQALPTPIGLPSGGALPPGPQELQGLAKARAMKAAGNHLAGQQAELNKARRELDKYKGRFEKVESVRDMPKGFLKLNPLKGRPWQERVIVGSLWQFGSRERFVVDMAPYAAWRWTDKLSTGAGGQYRLSLSLKEKPWVSGQDKVAGVFVFTDVDVYKGLFARLHYEHLSAPVPVKTAPGLAEAQTQAWVPGLSLGAGKRYTFYKAIQGYALVEYNLLHEHGVTPYLQPLQARIGFFLLASQLGGKKERGASQ
ncbi:hypothetical protein [Pontibacter burrus]|uniref:Uncharacterized protein n=1 Tax=Pontibacter burrus TaxID=2704466 RepID=A0A6B3LV55_9BACT|nr:hypothetical protein [Pontibacter burrus]NEM97420.1 hypothetical protein [Pontibacter burrus]